MPYSPTELQIIEDSLLSLYYGYGYFTLRDSLAMSKNIPPSVKYILGPGDEIIVTMWGETQFQQNYFVDTEGTIFDEKIGKIIISGKSLENTQKYLSKSFEKVYSTLSGANPSTFIDISLGKLKSINVNFIGHVNYPGLHSLHPFSNVLNGLIQAGGIDTVGTLRNIELIETKDCLKKLTCINFLMEEKI